MDFGTALHALKGGKRVARAGWNGKGMWLALSPGNPALEAGKFWAGPNRAYAEENGGTAPVLPCITMKTATGEILMGWLASQTDMLAEDWTIVLDINRDPLPGWESAPPPEEPPPPPPVNVNAIIAAAVERLLALAETGNMGRMPEKPVDLLVKVCRSHLTEKGAEIPQDLRDLCNDALLAALMGGR